MTDQPTAPEPAEPDPDAPTPTELGNDAQLDQAGDLDTVEEQAREALHDAANEEAMTAATEPQDDGLAETEEG